MLAISRAQVDALAVHARKHFEQRVFDHLRPHFPALFAALGEDEMRIVVEEGARRANDHGFVTERDVCRYVDLMCTLGWDFDEELPWAAQVLAAGGTMRELWDEAERHLARADHLRAAGLDAEARFGSTRAGDPCAAPRAPNSPRPA
jgi:hypothetical protein